MSTNSERKARSPYQRYSKKPRRYSELYQRWKSAVMDGNRHLAQQLSASHAERFLGSTTTGAEA